jgi:hypothetical protein
MLQGRQPCEGLSFPFRDAGAPYSVRPVSRAMAAMTLGSVGSVWTCFLKIGPARLKVLPKFGCYSATRAARTVIANSTTDAVMKIAKRSRMMLTVACTRLWTIRSPT